MDRRKVTAVALAIAAMAAAVAVPATRRPHDAGGAAATAAAVAPVALRPVDGGAAPYGRWPRSLPTADAFFPVGVWFESVTQPADVAADREAGLNTYVALTANSDLSLVASAGMKVIPQYGEWLHAAAAPGSEAIAGWLLGDELDMQDGPDRGREALAAARRAVPANDGRLRYANFGKGVAFWEDDADARRFVRDFTDVVSADNYWFTDQSICAAGQGGKLLGAGRALSDSECHRAANYGATVARLRALAGGAKPVWAFVEVGHPFTEGDWPTIRPAQVRAAVWQSLIAGARGIIYFNHSFGGPCPTQHALREPCYSAVRAVVSATDAQIHKLAGVLNAPAVEGGWSHSPGVTASLKWHDGALYLLTGSAGARTTATFTLPCPSRGRATVLGEQRTIPVDGRTVSDTFADANAIHLYRITPTAACAADIGR